MAIGTHIKKRMAELGMRPTDLLARCKAIEPRSRISQQQISAMGKRDTKRSQYVALVTRALTLTAEQLMSGKWPRDSSFSPHMLTAREPARPYGFTPEALMWAQHFDTLDEAIRRKWWVMALCLGDALPDDEVEKFIPTLPDGANIER